ncbi:MAG: hypothetical protein JHD00_11930 [Akkermansiaceae bacterium]|nr:hypothetical protein [Akkermansiaceae bacterium]
MTYYQRIIYQNTLGAADWHGWFPAYFTGSRARLAGFTRTGGAGAGPSKRGTSERRPRRARRFGEKPMSGEPSIIAEFTAIFTGFSRSGRIREQTTYFLVVSQSAGYDYHRTLARNV